jgi:hypothetical protein
VAFQPHIFHQIQRIFMKQLRLAGLVLPLFVLFSHSLHAQETPEPKPLHGEVGVSFSTLSLTSFNFDTFWKRQLGPNRFRRVQVSVNLQANAATTNTSSTALTEAQTSGVISIGREKRLHLDDRLQFLYGPEFQLSFNLSASNRLFPRVFASPGMGYALGVQHQIAKRWSANLVIVPSISLAFGSVPSTGIQQVSFDANFSNSASLGLVRCF